MTSTVKGHKAIEQISTKLVHLAVEYISESTLVFNSWNPNRQSDHDFALLLASMRTDGFTVPVLVLREGNIVVDGEHRVRAARHLNQEAREKGEPEPYLSIPVVFVNMSEAQARVATLRHNRARGSEDIELSAQLLRDLEAVGALDWAQDQLLMDDIEVQRMLSDIAAPEALAAEEFSQAWVPQGTKVTGETEGHESYIGGAQSTEGSTQLASDRLRESEKRMAAAKSDEERQSALRDRDIHRVALTFAGDEADIVKRALGDRPADKLLSMCRKELGLEG